MSDPAPSEITEVETQPGAEPTDAKIPSPRVAPEELVKPVESAVEATTEAVPVVEPVAAEVDTQKKEGGDGAVELVPTKGNSRNPDALPVKKGSRDVTPVSSINKDDKGEKKHHGHGHGHGHGKKHDGGGDHSVSKTLSAETGGTQENTADEKEKERLEEIQRERDEKIKAMKKRVDDVLESTPVVAVMAVLTIWALFSDDLRLAAAGPEADVAFTVIISFAFFLFAAEIVAASFAKEDYLHIPNQANLAGETILQSFMRRSEIGSFYFWLDIIATLSLIFEIDWMNVSLSSDDVSYGDETAARAQRLVRIVRMVRLVRLVKLYKYSTNLKKKGVEGGEEDEKAAAAAAIKAADAAAEGGEAVVKEKQEDVVQGESQVGAAMTDLTNKRVVILVLIMLIIVPLLDVTAIDFQPILAITFIHKCAAGHLAGTDATFDNALQLAVEMASYANTKTVSLDFTYNGASGLLYSWDDRDRLDGLRDVEKIEISTTTGGLTTTMIFDDSTNSRISAAFAMYTTLFVVILLITGTIVLSHDTDRLLIVPIERMVELVQKISANPLGVEYKMLGAEDGFVEGMETTTLLSTITKIGRLMRVGFGEAGADVIGRNMRSAGVGGKLNLLGKGEKIMSIYGFCDVRQFTDTTECLQEEVMLFVNRIGHILHSIVVQCAGAANKNIGDAFLLTWKVEKRYTPKEKTALADQALLCFCKALIELGRYQEFIINFSAASTARLYKRFPGYNVRIGSGLHMGWAIEGAIGSHRKIDASYLSPHVNFTEFLESSTKAYGTPLLISEPCYDMFSNTAKRYIRKVDAVRKSKNPNEPIIGLYTYDSDLSIDWADPNRKLIAKKLMPTLKAITGKFQAAARRASIGAAARLAMTPEEIAAEAEKKKEKKRLEEAERAANDKKTKPPEIKIEKYREDVWRVDPDLIDLRHRVNESFRKSFHEGIDFYIKGEWEEAKKKFDRCVNLSKNNGPPDGPSTFLLNFMGETDFVPPSDWEGYRIDS